MRLLLIGVARNFVSEGGNSVKWLIGLLLCVLVGLQARLWFGEGGLEERARLQARIEEQREINRILSERNRRLEVEVFELQRGLETIEERARTDLGMVKEGEIYYQLLNDPDTAIRKNSESSTKGHEQSRGAGLSGNPSASGGDKG